MAYTKVAAESSGEFNITKEVFGKINDAVYDVKHNVLNPMDYGAKGDGVTDDTAAINACYNDVPANGGIVQFPPGDYLATNVLSPKSHTITLGCSMPRYQSASNPSYACKIRMGAGFAGTALFTPTSAIKGLGFHNISLVGNQIGANLHCFRFPENSTYAGEQDWNFVNVAIHGFTGSGICGRLHVARFVNCHIARCDNWCIETETGAGNKWNDIKVIGCYFYYGKNGCIHLGGTNSGISGGIEFLACRIERGGNTPGSPLANANTDAPGVKLTNAQRIIFVGCSTDGNSGDGILLLRTAADALQVNNIVVNGCTFGRDGGGDQVTLPNRASIRVQGFNGANPVNIVKIVGCDGISGKADDAGGGIISPKYGTMLDYAYDVDFDSSYIEGATAQFLVGGGGVGQLWRSSINDNRAKLMTIPSNNGAPATIIADASSNENAQIYYDTADSKIAVRHGGAWKKTAALA